MSKTEPRFQTLSSSTMFKYWSSIASPPLSFLSLRPSIIDAGANSRAGMEVPDDPEVGPNKEQSTLQPLIESQVRDLTRTLAEIQEPKTQLCVATVQYSQCNDPQM